MIVSDFMIAGLKLIQPTIFRDTRGFFIESYHEKDWRSIGIDIRFVQDNHSFSKMGVLRGLHYQSAPGQAKLIRVSRGLIYDVAVDLRPKSPTFGKWQSVYLDDRSHNQFFIPVGFAHGFCVISEGADVCYKVSSLYNPTTEGSLKWNDPELDVKWPISHPILSQRDSRAESFIDYCKKLPCGHVFNELMNTINER